MIPKLAFYWRCPSCKENLVLAARHWQCANLHCFDTAKEGYVNLLLAQKKNSKDPGDNKNMVNARRHFLEQNHYLPLATKIADLLHQHMLEREPKASVFSLLDAGCGEGYYLANIANIVLQKNSGDSRPELFARGIDISKSAIQKAAKKYKNNDSAEFNFAVASCFDLPIIDNSQDALIQIFAPAIEHEMSRVIKNKGVWIKVSPASDHLYELKRMVYDTPAKHEVDDKLPAEFSLVSQQDLRFDISLAKPSDRQNLLMMTPFYWTISEAKKQKLLADLQTTEAHFDIRVFQKHETK